MNLVVIFSFLLAGVAALPYQPINDELKSQPISWPFSSPGYDVTGRHSRAFSRDDSLSENILQSKDAIKAELDLEQILGDIQPEKGTDYLSEPSQARGQKPLPLPNLNMGIEDDDFPHGGQKPLEVVRNRKAADIDDLDMDQNVLDMSEDELRTAIQGVDDSMLQLVPLGCRKALALHALVGFCRHTVSRVLREQWQQLVEDYRDLDRLRTSAGLSQPVLDDGTAQLWRAITDRVGDDMDEKFRTWAPSTDEIHLEEIYEPWLRTISLAAVTDETTAELLMTMAIVNQVFIAPFTGNNVTCDVTGSIDDLTNHVTDLGFFLSNVTVAYFGSVKLPTDVKPILNVRMQLVLERVAAQMTHYIRALMEDNSGTLSFLKRAAEREGTARVSLIAKLKVLMKEQMKPEFMDFVTQEITMGRSQQMFEMLFRATALSSAELDVAPPDAETLLGGITDLLTARIDDPFDSSAVSKKLKATYLQL